MSSSSTSHGYFDSVSTQLSLSVGSSFEGVAGNSSANVSEGVSASVSAVDTGMKAGMALAGAFDAGMESAYVPALAGLGLKSMACLPISKQLDPVLGIDCHIMIPGGPLPNPYIGLLINPADFITAGIASVLPPPPPMPEEGGGGDADGAKMAGIAHTVATIVIGMMGATVKIGNFIPRAVAGTFTRNIFHFPIGGAFALPPMNKGHAFMGSLNVLADGDSKTRLSAQVRRQRKYHWGSADRLLKTEDNRFGTTTYEYSPTGHLQKAVYADGREEYRLSDKAGNLFDDPDRKLRKYLRGGKLEQSGEWRFVYDRDGQLVEKYKGSGKWWDSKSERWRYIWNQNGTLKEVRPPGGGDFAFDALFTYDALGRRLSKDAIGITCWLWNGNVPLHEWTPKRRRNEQGEIEENQKDLRTWLFEEESFVPLALFQDGKAYSIVTDHLGTPVEAYNEQGEEVWYRRLDMNGKVIEERSMNYTSYKDYVRIPFLFQGQYYDEEIKLAYNRFRYYDPELGRYISQDPIRFESGTTTLYNYVEDPNIYLDVLGEYPSSINRHHLIPQEMFNDPDFMRQLKKIGIRDPKAYIHRQTADITELKHQEIHKGIHGGAWNSDFKEWYDRNSNFSKKELQQQLKKMMRNYNIPSSSRNFSRKYGRKPRKKSRKTIGYR